MVTLVLPCAGKGSRLGLAYPKEIQATGHNRILLDNSLDLAKMANIKRALIVTNKSKLKYFQEFVGHNRNDIQIEYFINENYNSLPGSILSGCKYLNRKFSEMHFIAGLPDTMISNLNSYRDIITLNHYPVMSLFDQPANLYDAVYTNENDEIINVRVKKDFNPKYGKFQGTWGIIGMDIDTVNRLYMLMETTTPKKEGDLFLMGELIDMDCKNYQWNYLLNNSKYLDLGTWKILSEYLFNLWS